MLTPEKIEELRGLLAKATPGPWKNHLVDDTTIVASNGFEIGTTWPGGSVYNGFVDPAEQHEINAALIVAMRNALPALLDLAPKALATLSLAGEDAAGLCERLEKRAAFWERYWTGRSLQDPDSGPIREAAALIRSLSLRVEAEKRAREAAEESRDAWHKIACDDAAHSAALARALEDVSAKVDAFWNDPERPSVHRMRSKSVHELSDAQRRARSLLAPKEDTDA